MVVGTNRASSGVSGVAHAYPKSPTAAAPRTEVHGRRLFDFFTALLPTERRIRLVQRPRWDGSEGFRVGDLRPSRRVTMITTGPQAILEFAHALARANYYGIRLLRERKRT
jgi:hypothetical protein